MRSTPEEKDFLLTYYGQLIALSLQLYRTAGATSLVIATPADDETAYLRHTGIAATYACSFYQLDFRHVIWVERRPTPDAQGDSFTLVEFDRSIVQGVSGPEVILSTPSRTPLPDDQLRLMQRRLEEEEGESP
jgi:hypothetical protein